jgi:hypothetical protein
MPFEQAVPALPTENSILNFTPDTRFGTVHYSGYRGTEKVASWSLAVHRLGRGGQLVGDQP